MLGIKDRIIFHRARATTWHLLYGPLIARWRSSLAIVILMLYALFFNLSDLKLSGHQFPEFHSWHAGWGFLGFEVQMSLSCYGWETLIIWNMVVTFFWFYSDTFRSLFKISRPYSAFILLYLPNKYLWTVLRWVIKKCCKQKIRPSDFAIASLE